MAITQFGWPQQHKCVNSLENNSGGGELPKNHPVVKQWPKFHIHLQKTVDHVSGETCIYIYKPQAEMMTAIVDTYPNIKLDILIGDSLYIEADCWDGGHWLA